LTEMPSKTDLKGHAFGASFTGVGGKRKHAVCAVWEAFAL
jgi:hypothetical protein